MEKETCPCRMMETEPHNGSSCTSSPSSWFTSSLAPLPIQSRLLLGKLTQRATAEVLELKANTLQGYNATNHTGNQGPSFNMWGDQQVGRKGRVEGKWDIGSVE